ncbi:phosphotransferase [Paenibacillus sp. CF384]|uniref:phosphotransferase n=1 Tax=Paenibacillus sp. CF384 TaxID=1884382 RepID=UPI0008985831|nr:phosphotransferase [Paenibacillus sp. CF384]SDW80987.1 Ser/Thr protein kinase RdoA involved in Cpx stress response, MazF antagonist [Paenibacillus sp. CF384]
MYNQPMALRSVLDPKYLAYCLSGNYNIGPWHECLFWLRGLNDTYRIRTSNGTYMLRIYRLAVHESDVIAELSVLIQLKSILSAMNTKVSEPIAKVDNSLHTVIDAPEGKRIAVIFRYIDGVENVLQDEESCYAFGISAGELHMAMDQVILNEPRYELDTNVLISQPLARILTYIGEESPAANFLQRFANELIERVNQAAKQGLDWGLCHGDMHGNNNAFQLDKHFTHYDFEWAARGWRAYDLAQVRGRKRQLTDKKEPLWDAFMAGYRSVRSFTVQDEEAIQLFMIVRRLWVMGLDTSFIPTDSGVLDYSEDWLEGFVHEFQSYNII